MLIVLGLFAAGVFGVLLPLLGPDLTMTPGDTGDARFNLYVLEHFHAWATGRVESYWDAPFMYPSADVIARSDAHLGTAWIHSLLRSAGAGPSGAFQGWIIALFTLNFWCCAIAFRTWTGRWVIAGCAAYIYTFGILGLTQLYNIQMLPRFMAPLALLALHRALSTSSPAWILATVLAVAVQFYCAIYSGLILLFALLCLLIGRAIVGGVSITRKGVMAWSVGAVAGALLLLPLLLPYTRVAAQVMPYDPEMVALTIPRPASYIYSHPSAISWASLHRPEMIDMPNAWEHHHFPGALPWLGVLIAIPWWWRIRCSPLGRSLAALLIAWAVSMIVPLWIGGFSLFQLLRSVPGFDIIRSVGRFVLIDQLFFLLVGATVAVSLPKGTRASWVLELALPLLVLLDNKSDATAIPRFDRDLADRGVDQVEADIRSELKEGTVAVAYAPVWGCRTERHGELITLHVQAMLAAQRIGIPVVNGYSGSLPEGLQPFWDDPGAANLDHWLKASGVVLEVELVDGLPSEMLARDTVTIGMVDGGFIGTGRWPEEPVTTDRTEALEWETFIRLRLADGSWAFVAHHNGYLTAELHHGSQLAAAAHRLGDMGLFRPERLADGNYLLRAHGGSYLQQKDGAVGAWADSASATPFRVRSLRSTPEER
ncbi:MAG TPA: hypothetical protein VGE21_09240 [Flavobacteriales bacterium]